MMAKVREVDEEKGKYKDEKQGTKMILCTNTLQDRGEQMCYVPHDIKKKKDSSFNPGYVLENQYNSANEEGACAHMQGCDFRTGT